MALTFQVKAQALHHHAGQVGGRNLKTRGPKIRQLSKPDQRQRHYQRHDQHPGPQQTAQGAVEKGTQCAGNGGFHQPYIVSANSSRPINMRRISLVPAPIS
jgi:hypothetical protein